MQCIKIGRALQGAVGLLAATLLSTGTAQAAGVPGQGTWETTLLPRDLDGDASNGPEAFYDTALDITWLRKAAVTELNWESANTWASTLEVNGISGWRLPQMLLDTGAPGCDWNWAGTDCGYNADTTTSELAHLFFVTLGNKSLSDASGRQQPGFGLSNTGDFEGLTGNWWTGTPYPQVGYAWYFVAWRGEQSFNEHRFSFTSMAVLDGDVAAIPEPQTYGLMLLGLVALAAVQRRRHG